MKKILLLILSVCSVLTFSDVYAQQDAQFSQYMFNGLYINPGYAGIEGVTRYTFIHRTQWLGYSPAPYSTILSGSTKLPGKIGGAGIYIMNDKLGPLGTLSAQLIYSYHVKIKNGTLGIGIKGGINNQRLNGNYKVVDETDPVYQYFKSNGNVSQTKPDFAFGLYYKTKKYYLGASTNHLTGSRYSFGNKDSIQSKLVNHMYFTGGYNIELGTNLLVTPSVLVQTDLREVSYLFGAIATYNNKIWAGINARQSLPHKETAKKGRTLSNDDLIFYLGINLLKNKQGNDALRLGYAFDLVTSGKKAKAGTSHEILLSYMTPIPWAGAKPIIRTPRYRHEEN